MIPSKSAEKSFCKHCHRAYFSSLDKSSCRRSGFCSKECSLLPVFERNHTASLTTKVDQLSLSSSPTKENSSTSTHGAAEEQSSNAPSRITGTTTTTTSTVYPPKQVLPLPLPRQIPTLQQLCIKMLVDNSRAISDLSGLDIFTGTCILKEVISTVTFHI
jgi:hypothetical protein